MNGFVRFVSSQTSRPASAARPAQPSSVDATPYPAEPRSLVSGGQFLDRGFIGHYCRRCGLTRLGLVLSGAAERWAGEWRGAERVGCLQVSRLLCRVSRELKSSQSSVHAMSSLAARSLPTSPPSLPTSPPSGNSLSWNGSHHPSVRNQGSSPDLWFAQNRIRRHIPRRSGTGHHSLTRARDREPHSPNLGDRCRRLPLSHRGCRMARIHHRHSSACIHITRNSVHICGSGCRSDT